MTTKTHRASPAPCKATASRREFVTAAVTLAAAAGAATGAQAQTPTNLRFSNPPGMSNPPGYSHVVEVTGPHRVVYLAGQTGADANGKVADGSSRTGGAGVREHQDRAGLGRRRLRARRQGDGLPHQSRRQRRHLSRGARHLLREQGGAAGHTLLQISRLANPAYQLELEIIAILPPKA